MALTPCREWQGTCTRAGYGHRYVKGRRGKLIRNEKQQIIGHEGNVRGHYDYIPPKGKRECLACLLERRLS